MNATYIAVFLLLFVVLTGQQQEKKAIAVRRLIARRKKGGKTMTEMLDCYVGKECIVYTMNSQVSGVIKEIRDGWLKLDNGKDVDAINLDFVVRVREYPRNKKGKKVSVVLD